MLVDKSPLEEAYLEHISERSWSTYTKADYTPEQWHRACLIHQHSETPTSKNQCKLPVRTPNGAINRNGVHAAAAALAGARGGVNASSEEIASAQTALKRLYGELGEEAPSSISHAGVKGMRWGHRKPEEIGTGRTGAGQSSGGLSPRNQKLVTAALVAGTVAVGALMLSRGKVPVWNSTSTKIVMGGARMSGNILGKTGSVIVRGSAKTAMVTGKVAFKSGKIGGKIAGRGALGAAKGVASSTASGGSNFLNNVLKPSGALTVRLGSAASHHLTGRGTPWVTEAVTRPMSLNPIDLLLNTRADFKRGA